MVGRGHAQPGPGRGGDARGRHHRRERQRRRRRRAPQGAPRLDGGEHHRHQRTGNNHVVYAYTAQ